MYVYISSTVLRFTWTMLTPENNILSHTRLCIWDDGKCALRSIRTRYMHVCTRDDWQKEEKEEEKEVRLNSSRCINNWAAVHRQKFLTSVYLDDEVPRRTNATIMSRRLTFRSSEGWNSSHNDTPSRLALSVSRSFGYFINRSSKKRRSLRAIAFFLRIYKFTKQI